MEVVKEKDVQDISTEETRPKYHFGFGEFLVDTSSWLSSDAVKQLVLLFGFSVTEGDRIGGDNVKLINSLRKRGLISPTDISQLIHALEKINLQGVATKVQDSFEKLHGRGQKPRTMQEKSLLLVKALKKALKKSYNSVKPIPYVRDVWLCVNDIFVESQIEILDNSKSHGDPKRWSTLTSYNDVFTQPMFEEGEVIILEGEPGYGKSTMLLQYAYDWCMSSTTSPLKDVNMFILLRLKDLKGVKSVYDAIKVQLPEDLNLSSRDIQDIVANDHVKVVLALDGYDEYPDIDERDTDVEKIIQGRILSSCVVVVATRPSCLPKLQSPTVKRCRLTGFDQNMQKKYIKKALTTDAEVLGVQNLIMGKLQENVILTDICQVPLFFVMFAHMICNDPRSEHFYSVTSYFSFMLTCFFSHLENKVTGVSRTDRRSIGQEDPKQRLQVANLAFDGLSGKEQRLLWNKEEILEHVDYSCLDRYLKAGILIEERRSSVKVQLGFLAHSHILEEVNVRFFHKTFQEFYAAFYIVHLAKSMASEDVKKLLTKFNLDDLQYVFRFACGLEPASATLVLEFLRGLAKAGRMFSMLCIMEQGAESASSVVADLCRKQVTLSVNDSRLLQRSKIQLLQTASHRKIPISSVCLHLCFDSVDLKTESLCLSSGIYLPRLDSLQQLVINGDHKTDLTGIAEDVLDYSSRCVALNTLEFVGVTLPSSLYNKNVLENLGKKNCEVFWYFGDDRKLNLLSGQWQDRRGEETFEPEGEVVESKVAKLVQQQITLSKNDGMALQKWKIRLLQTASDRKILIASLCLNMCFSVVDLKLESICLSTGLKLPKLDSLQALVIYYSRITDLGERSHDVLSYSAMCVALKTVEFVGVLLPQFFDNKDVLDILYRNNCEVIWYFVEDWRLNLQSGRWEDERGRQVTQTQYRNAVQHSKGDGVKQPVT